jgi:hypothetical protein
MSGPFPNSEAKDASGQRSIGTEAEGFHTQWALAEIVARGHMRKQEVDRPGGRLIGIHWRIAAA